MAAGSIVVDLLMRTGSFETDTKRAEKRLRELEKTAKQIGTAIGTAAAAVGAAGVLLLKTSIDSADAFAKQAQSAGTTVEALTALAYAADLSGVAQEDLTTSLVRLARTASDADKGTKSAAEAFDALGVKVRDASGQLKPADKLLAEVSERFARMEDGTRKTALATELFGKAGAKLIPLLNTGSQGLREAADEARELGLVLSTETSKAAEQFNDDLSRLSKLARGFGNDLATQMLPVLTQVSGLLVDIGKAARESGDGIDVASDIAKAFTVTLQALTILASDVAFTFKGVGREIGAVAAQIALAAEFINLPFTERIKRFGEFRIRFTAISDAVKEDGVRARAALDDFQRRVMGLGKPFTTMGSENDPRRGRGYTAPAAPFVPGSGSSGGGGKKAKVEIDQVAAALADLNRELALFGQEGTDLDKLLRFESLGPTTAQLEQFKSQLQQMADLKTADDIRKTIDALEQQRIESALNSEQIAIRRLALQGASQDELAYAQSILAGSKATKESQEAIQAGKEIYEATRTPAEQLAREIDRLNVLLQKGAIDWDTYARAQFAAQDKFDEATKKVEKTADSFTKKFAENVQDVLGQGLYDAMNGNFKNIGDAFVSMINRMVAEAIAADLTRRLFGTDSQGGVSGTGGWIGDIGKWLGVGSGSGGGTGAWGGAWSHGGTGGSGGIWGSLLSAAGSWFGGAKAGGGDVMAGRGYLVGEQGPEMFVPRTAGTILTARETQSMGRSMSVVQNFTLQQPADRRTQQQVGAIASRGLADAARRGN